jgi:hypothetical protein
MGKGEKVLWFPVAGGQWNLIENAILRWRKRTQRTTKGRLFRSLLRLSLLGLVDLTSFVLSRLS